MPPKSPEPKSKSLPEGTSPSAGGWSNMRESIRDFDWSVTIIGPVSHWPARLRVIVDLMLDSAEPMVIWWGPDRLQIYNDAYAERVDREARGRALGRPARDTWKHGWATFEPLVQGVFHGGASKTRNDFAFDIERNGKLEEAYWTYSLTPIRNEKGIVQGVLLLSSEVTEKALTARRHRTLEILRNDLVGVDTLDQLAESSLRAAALNPDDLQGVRFHTTSGEGLASCDTLVKARDVGIDVDLAIEFLPAPKVARDHTYRVFIEQFSLLVAAAQQRIEGEARRRITEAERDRLLLDAPVGAAVMIGENLVYHLVNSVYADVSGRLADEMVNKPFGDVYPELCGSPVHEKFKEVYRSGKPFISEPTLVQIHRNGGALDDRFFTYNLSPLRTLAGEVFGLMVIAVDITTEVESRSHVEKLNVELEAAARAKDEFLAMLAHELRNPLAPIGAAAELLQMMEMDEKIVRQTSRVIGRQVRHMTSLVDDLLDVSRLTRGLVDLDIDELDIRHVVADAVEQVMPLIQARRHCLALDLPPETTKINGDKKRLIQVVANILNNAAKFTSEGGNISLRVDSRDGCVVIEITDDGIGMEHDLASRAFDLFAQAHRTPDRSSGGLGLGLALVKSLVELHGGVATCASAGLGKGSTFSVQLPDLVEHGSEPTTQSAGVSVEQDATPLQILLVDDNDDAAEMLALLLGASGHHVMVEHSSRQALQRARQLAPQICILDIGLPEMDGNELARALRAQPETAHSLLIAVTGYGQSNDREQTKAAGFDHHFVKPVDIKKLSAVLAHVSRKVAGALENGLVPRDPST